jgi:hypothetical protein
VSAVEVHGMGSDWFGNEGLPTYEDDGMRTRRHATR